MTSSRGGNSPREFLELSHNLSAFTLVAKEALVWDEEQAYVFVASGETVKRQPVKLGLRDAESAEVLESIDFFAREPWEEGDFFYAKTDFEEQWTAEGKTMCYDFHATVLHLLGIDHNRLTFPFQGLDQKLTGVEKSRVVKEILA